MQHKSENNPEIRAILKARKENQNNIFSSPLAGEEDRRAGEGYPIGKLYSSPSFELRPPSPSVGRRVHGFTLIELLVVVLIIGILAAVAIPQYQVSVDKARYMEMLVNSKSLAQSIGVYYMANGSYPAYWNQLDIGIEDCTETNIAKYLLTCKKFTVDLNDENFMANVGIGVRLWYYFGNGELGRFRCNASSTRRNRLCKSIMRFRKLLLKLMAIFSYARVRALI